MSTSQNYRNWCPVYRIFTSLRGRKEESASCSCGYRVGKQFSNITTTNIIEKKSFTRFLSRTKNVWYTKQNIKPTWEKPWEGLMEGQNRSLTLILQSSRSHTRSIITFWWRKKSKKTLKYNLSIRSNAIRLTKKMKNLTFLKICKKTLYLFPKINSCKLLVKTSLGALPLSTIKFKFTVARG